MWSLLLCMCGAGAGAELRQLEVLGRGKMARRVAGQQVGELSAGGEWMGREVSPGRGIASVTYCKEVCQVCSRSQGWLRLPG